MRIIPKNTKVSTEFFKGVTLADMIVGFFGILIVFLIAVSSLPYRGYIALGFAFILVFLLVRIDDEANYMFLFRIIRHMSYYRSYRKPGFEYPEIVDLEDSENKENSEDKPEVTTEIDEEAVSVESVEESLGNREDTKNSETSLDVAVAGLTLDNDMEISEETQSKEINPLQSELKNDGFEILDLEEIEKEVTFERETAEIVKDSKKKAPQSVLKNIKNKLSKVEKGDS